MLAIISELFFQKYIPIILSKIYTYYSQNYASIIGAGLIGRVGVSSMLVNAH